MALDLSRLAREVHVMVDLETMGNGSNAALVQIGAVAYTPYRPLGEKRGWLKKYGEFNHHVSLGSCVNKGLTMDASTVLWWLRQSKEAQEAVFGTLENPIEGTGVLEALTAFSNWIKNIGRKDVPVWGHGATFDVVILSNAYKSCGAGCPYSFRDGRDTRTILNSVENDCSVSTFGLWSDYADDIDPALGVTRFSEFGPKHDALADAKRQAVVMQRAYSRIAGEF